MLIEWAGGWMKVPNNSDIQYFNLYPVNDEDGTLVLYMDIHFVFVLTYGNTITTELVKKEEVVVFMDEYNDISAYKDQIEFIKRSIRCSNRDINITDELLNNHDTVDGM